MTTESKIDTLIVEARKKNSEVHAQILLAGGKGAGGPLITLDSELQVIKDVLFKEGLISEKSFELETLNKTHILLERVLEALKEMKKKMNKIIIPKIVPPKGIRKVRA